MSTRLRFAKKLHAESRQARQRLRWPLSSEEVRAHPPAFEQMWEEIARGTRPCVCSVTLDRQHVRVVRKASTGSRTTQSRNSK
jgi:hypothetical protein